MQEEEFLAVVHRFESSAVQTPELDELGGTFVRSLMRVGWCREANGAIARWPPHGQRLKVLLDEGERRAAFKVTWTKVVGLEARSEFALSLDENRALYRFYFSHPHAPESQEAALAAARLQSKNDETCAKIDDGERTAALYWLLAKLKDYEAVDPSYPFDYARGIALYHRREYGASADAFRAWLDAHPGGPWTLRAQNYLAAAERAARAF